MTRRGAPETRQRSLNDLVGAYSRNHRPRACTEYDFLREMETDEEAISEAALARRKDGKRHDHQRRIQRSSLEESRRRLLQNVALLRSSRSFEELFDTINAIIRPIPRIGELAVYDTALRIGVRFKHEPTLVYLHAGTREGAAALGIDTARSTAEMTELPKALHRLTPREVEDFLCIYKDDLKQLRGGVHPGGA